MNTNASPPDSAGDATKPNGSTNAAMSSPSSSGSAAASDTGRRFGGLRPGAFTSVFPGTGRLLRAYSDWLAAISWWRFIVLAVLFMAAVGILTEMSFFQVPGQARATVRYEVHIDENGAVSITPEDRNARKAADAARKDAAVLRREVAQAAADARKEIAAAEAAAKRGDERPTPAAAQGGDDTDGKANVHITKDGVVIDAHDGSDRKRITIDNQGVHIEKSGATSAQPAVPVPPTPPKPPAAPPGPSSSTLPAAPTGSDSVAQAAADIAARDASRAKIEESLTETISDLEDLANERTQASRRGALGDSLHTFSIFFVIFSVIMKVEAGRRVKVEVKAAAATELAEAEQLKRQLVEARMQTMQAQVEPHFLFNTLASIDHLIETDPPRASAMQKNLIQYLRAALPKMRESSTTLGREVDLIRAYLEILKVRMEDRLRTDYAVPDGLRSAAFPPMMLQSLVENAIKHGLEPKADGGAIRVAAEIVDGHLRVTVADTGLGFDPDNGRTRGTGIGLTNIRERLALLHDGKGTLTVAPNTPSGTVVAIELPYAIVRG